MNDIPFQVRDIWLASFALERGARFLGPHRDERTGYIYWDFDAMDMESVMSEWGSMTAQVNVRKFHDKFFYLKGMLGKG